MELVENGSLDDLLRRHGTFSVAEAVEMFREIAVGLAHAHGKGVLHCDLKPANILLDQDQKPRLADFGQSRLSHEQKPALGTLFYMAPEQADLEAVPDVRWDVYALGAIFYSLLLGYPPHRNDESVSKLDTAGDLADRLARYRQVIRSAPPPADHRRVPGMDRAMAEIIDRCLAADPDDRFANVQEVLDALAARDRNRAQLPLLVLGFVGPLLVLLVTAFFSYRGYSRAVREAEQGYSQWAVANNQFAAQLAAEKVTGEISRYFEIARDEVDRPHLLPLLMGVLDSPALARLSNPQITEDEIAPAQTAFYQETQRLALDRYLQSRLDEYREVAEKNPNAPRFASVFITDSLGTQLASAFEEEVKSASIGKNWAHRTYFHGGPVELPPFPRPQPNARHITRTHLSAVFKSSTTKKWKVAVSTPFYREDPERPGEQQFAGILVLTVNVGDFEFFRSTMSPKHDRFAVLVDGRAGEGAGTILQHPMFDDLLGKQQSLPDELVKPDYRVSTQVLSTGSQEEYYDPLGKFPDQHDIAKGYNRRWVAAASGVRSPAADNGTSDSGLVVLVQSDYQAVVKPARQLGGQFIRNSFWMLVVMVVVSLALWYIVVRLFREPRAGLPRASDGASASTPLHSMTTIAAQTRQQP
jgi:hypothetical protein